MKTQATILVVDDDITVQDTLERLLTSRGYAVKTAGTGEEALDILTGQPCELILTDLQMPGMDGLELLRQIKSSRPKVPVVMITAYAGTEVVIQALRGGVSDFLTKPYNAAELEMIVQREIERYQLISNEQAAGAAVASQVAPAVLGRQFSPDQLDAIDHLVADLRAHSGARCVMVMESTGHVISAKGIIEEMNVSALAALVSGDFSAAAGIASIIGESDAFTLNYHEGKRYSAYSARLTPEVFLLIIFGHETKFGMIVYETRRILPDLQEIVSQPAGATSIQEIIQTTLQEVQKDAPEETFSLEQALESGLLGDNFLSRVDEQLETLWN